MNLFALVVIICNTQTPQCDSYVMALYKDAKSCETDAALMRKERNDGILGIYCRNTTKPTRK